MKIKSAKFLISSPSIKTCVESDLPEIALLGRSNVGKSSFINVFTNSKIAKTSNKPGKTRLINQYLVNENFIISDLPGFGFANVSKAIKNLWGKNLEEYLISRKNLKLFLQFIDIRHKLQTNDQNMAKWLNFNNKNYIVVLTKADLISKNDLNSKINYYKHIFLKENVYVFSNKYTRFNNLLYEKIEMELF